ncbi:hypothetical protein Btru_036162 [Bulinus truncatus]|nr:hypothetical protein Btru_036162 [Bulinus truncatus]
MVPQREQYSAGHGLAANDLYGQYKTDETMWTFHRHVRRMDSAESMKSKKIECNEIKVQSLPVLNGSSPGSQCKRWVHYDVLKRRTRSLCVFTLNSLVNKYVLIWLLVVVWRFYNDSCHLDTCMLCGYVIWTRVCCVVMSSGHVYAVWLCHLDTCMLCGYVIWTLYAVWLCHLDTRMMCGYVIWTRVCCVVMSSGHAYDVWLCHLDTRILCGYVLWTRVCCVVRSIGHVYAVWLCHLDTCMLCGYVIWTRVCCVVMSRVCCAICHDVVMANGPSDHQFCFKCLFWFSRKECIGDLWFCYQV